MTQTDNKYIRLAQLYQDSSQDSKMQTPDASNLTNLPYLTLAELISDICMIQDTELTLYASNSIVYDMSEDTSGDVPQ